MHLFTCAPGFQSTWPGSNANDQLGPMDTIWSASLSFEVIQVTEDWAANASTEARPSASAVARSHVTDSRGVARRGFGRVVASPHRVDGFRSPDRYSRIAIFLEIMEHGLVCQISLMPKGL